MKTVVAFIGSPRKNGNTAALVEEIVRGAKEAGAEAKIYTITDMNVKPCQSCFYCRKESTCAVNDDMHTVYEDIKKAAAVVIGSPIYMYQVTAPVKLLFDRFFPLIDTQFQPRFGTKKTIMVYSQGNPDVNAFKNSFDVNASVLEVMGLNVTDTILATGTNDINAVRSNTPLMEKAFQAGKALVE